MGMIMFSAITSIRKLECTPRRGMVHLRLAVADDARGQCAGAGGPSRLPVAFALMDPTGANQLTQAQLYALFKSIVRVRLLLPPLGRVPLRIHKG